MEYRVEDVIVNVDKQLDDTEKNVVLSVADILAYTLKSKNKKVLQALAVSMFITIENIKLLVMQEQLNQFEEENPI
jgi:hypothetical protein